jgi:UDP-N-acetylmuramoylalanine--D-glutamate ligase
LNECNTDEEPTLTVLIENMKKRLVILGGGESGVGAALLAKKKGYDVFLFDEGSLKAGYRNELESADIPFAEKDE